MADLMTDADRRFARCYAFTEREEGGLADRPLRDDPGGVTNRGVSLRFARSQGLMFDLDRDGDVDRDDILLVRPEHARWAFREIFWRPVHGEVLWPGLDLCAFDMAVHSGAPRATRFMQDALGVVADGVIGPRTLGAVAATRRDPMARQRVVHRFCDARRDWLRGLPNAAANPGWFPRVERCRNLALGFAR